MSGLKLPLGEERKKTFPWRQKSDSQCCQTQSSLPAGSTPNGAANRKNSGAEVKGHFSIPLDSSSSSSAYLPHIVLSSSSCLVSGFWAKMTTAAGGHRRGAILRTEAGAVTSAAASMTMTFEVIT